MIVLHMPDFYLWTFLLLLAQPNSTSILTRQLFEQYFFNNNLVGWILDFLNQHNTVNLNSVLSDLKCYSTSTAKVVCCQHYCLFFIQSSETALPSIPLTDRSDDSHPLHSEFQLLLLRRCSATSCRTKCYKSALFLLPSMD